MSVVGYRDVCPQSGLKGEASSVVQVVRDEPLQSLADVGAHSGVMFW
jgi:hypothetical protein